MMSKKGKETYLTRPSFDITDSKPHVPDSTPLELGNTLPLSPLRETHAQFRWGELRIASEIGSCGFAGTGVRLALRTLLDAPETPRERSSSGSDVAGRN